MICSQTIATNDHANFQPLLRCDNVYTNIGTPRGNSLVKVPGLQQDLAERIKKRSDDNTCARISGRFNSDITWEYETRTSGSDCKTSANTNAIRDAVRDYLQWMTSNGFDHACVRMSNCGTWKGLLQIADHGKKIQNGRCAGVL